MSNLNNYVGLNPIQRGLLNSSNNMALVTGGLNGGFFINTNDKFDYHFATNVFNAAGFTDSVPWDKVLEEYPVNKANGPFYKDRAIVGGGMVGIASFINQSAQNYAMGQIYAAQASSYRTQANLALDNIETQNAYLNEQGSQQIWNLATQKAQFKSEQMMAWAGSGFSDISTGDRRILSDTDRKFNEAAAGVRRSMFLQNFENWRSGMMEYSRLQYAAKSAERLSKASNSIFSYLGAAGNAAMSGLGAYWSLGGGKTKAVGININPKGNAG